MATTTETSRLSMPWFELAGRIAVGVPHLLGGTAILVAQAARFAKGEGQVFTTAIMTVFGLMTLAGGLSALAGRWVLPLALAFICLATALLSAAVPLLPGAAADFFTAENLLALLTVAFVLVRCGRGSAWARRAVPALAAGLCVVFLWMVPGTAVFMGSCGSLLFLPPVEKAAYGPGDGVGLVRFYREGGDRLALDGEGTVYVVNFWAAWCKPCVAELPLLLEMHREYASEERVRFLAVNTEALPRDQVEDFLARNGLSDLPVFADPRGEQDRLGIDMIPATLVIRDRTIQARIGGFAPDLPARLRSEIERALR